MPRDIQDKQFHDAFRGYSHEEVDSFLDEVALAFDRMYRQNQILERRIDELEQGGAVTGGRPGGAEIEMLRKTIDSAQRTAAEAVEEAQETAAQIVAEAETRAAAVTADAETRAREVIAEAEVRAGGIVSRALGTERELEARIGELRAFEDGYRDRLTSFLEGQLRVLTEAPLLQPPLDITPVAVRSEREEALVPAGPSAPRGTGDDAAPVGSASGAPDEAEAERAAGGPEIASLRVVTGPTRGRTGPSPAGSRPEPAGPPPGPTRRQDTRPTTRSAADGVDEEEHRSITRLFWGGEE
jgi:DivIVA domain-containing protein